MYEKSKHTLDTHEGKYYVGEQLQSARGLMALKWTMNRGAVQDWEAMTYLWDHINDNEFRYQMDADIAGMFMLEPCLNSKENREKVAEYWFEKQGVHRVYFALQAVMTLIGWGKDTGTVVNSGGGVTEVVPVYEGYPLRHAYQRVAWAGRDSTEWLQRELHKSGIALETSADNLIVQKMKEDLGRVSMDYEADCLKLAETPHEYKLPDDSIVKVRGEILTCSEMLFNPMICGKDLPSVQKLVHNSIQACPMDARADLLHSIVAAGGNTMWGQEVAGGSQDTYGARLTLELEKLYNGNANVNIKVQCPPEREIIAMIGANTLCNLSTFMGDSDDTTTQKMWLSKQEWDEGRQCVHRMSQS